MTCIVGIVENGKIFIGGDSAGVAGHSLQIRADEKVFKKDGTLFGFTTSFRMGQIIRYCLKIPEQPNSQNDYQYLCSYFIDELIKCFSDKGFLQKKDEVKSGGAFLLGYKGNLYQVENDFQVGKVTDSFSACGCGQDIALGALYELKNQDVKGKKSMAPSPKEKLIRALKAAEHFSAGVRGPFNIVSSEE